MREHLSRLEKLGEEEVLLPILDRISESLVKAAAIVGLPFLFLLLLQFSYLLF
ncbi:hypothetical protein JOC95_001232 [Bacillus tianshenii]|uniref:Uncharacterized protein n=1 Tax=Sutcliffiella tianshenii TaxID=1463404 RepID=A0ABS2NXJ6_9BACI|nr:hypothetical protein [Bacillus tianshenii]MBM7619383.1 hypothetical protein [Bacillus tianshenii]